MLWNFGRQEKIIDQRHFGILAYALQSIEQFDHEAFVKISEISTLNLSEFRARKNFPNFLCKILKPPGARLISIFI